MTVYNMLNYLPLTGQSEQVTWLAESVVWIETDPEHEQELIGLVDSAVGLIRQHPGYREDSWNGTARTVSSGQIAILFGVEWETAEDMRHCIDVCWQECRQLWEPCLKDGKTSVVVGVKDRERNENYNFEINNPSKYVSFAQLHVVTMPKFDWAVHKLFREAVDTLRQIPGFNGDMKLSHADVGLFALNVAWREPIDPSILLNSECWRRPEFAEAWAPYLEDNKTSLNIRIVRLMPADHLHKFPYSLIQRLSLLEKQKES